MGTPHRYSKLVGTLFISGLLLALSTPLAGQKSTTRGLNIGVHFQGASLSVEGADSDGGGGLGARIGYGLNRIVTLYVEGDGISVDSEGSERVKGTWTLGHVDLGARFHFANTLRAWVPYLDVALGGRFAGIKDLKVDGEDQPDIELNGGAFSFGGGIYFYFTQTFGLDLGLKFTGGEFTEVKFGSSSLGDLDLDASSTRLKLGIVWWP
jgi:hypothetical protein